MLYNIVINPAGASGKTMELWKHIRPLFDESGQAYVLHKSKKIGGIKEICYNLTSKGRETALVVIGGDGTMNEAVNGIADFDRTLFGFIPSGTGNDMVRDMGLPEEREDLVRKLLEGKVQRCADVGQLTFYNDDGGITTRRFNISSDFGFGAATCAFADRSKLKPFLNKVGMGRMIYPIEALRVVFTAKPVPVEITCDGEVTRYEKCLCAIAMNHCHEGGGLKFCPNADFTDGKLDLCVGDGLSHLGFMKMLPKVYKGDHLTVKGIHELRGEHIEMRAEEPLWTHTDGEVIGMSKHVEMRIIPEKLRLMV